MNTRILLLTVVIVASPFTVAGQTEIALAGGWYVPSGEDYDDTDPGPGFEATLRFGLNPSFQLGVGGQFNTHGVNFTDDDYSVPSVFVEPRWTGSGSGRVHPFVSGRLAWVRQSIDANGAANGFGYGGTAGISIDVGDSAALELGGAAYGLDFGDFTRDGQVRPDTDSSGWVWGLRIGFAFRP